MNFEKHDTKIFIASGKANSGKDTTCELINNYIKLIEEDKHVSKW